MATSKENKMSKSTCSLSLSFSLILMVSGCASIPRSTMPESQFSSLDCPAIADQLGQAKVTQERAARAKRGSWKVVMPIAIGARYINASRVKKEAERRQASLLQEQQAKNCAQIAG